MQWLDFLQDRLNDDTIWAASDQDDADLAGWGEYPKQVQAQVTAQRRLIQEYLATVAYYNTGPGQLAPAGEVTGLERALKILTSVYSGDPDYSTIEEQLE